MNTAEHALAEAIPFSLLMGALLTKLIQKRVLLRQDAVFFVDSTLLLFEQHRRDVNGPGPEVIDHARSRLTVLLERLSSMPEGDS
jgi:hypothetical protein